MNVVLTLLVRNEADILDEQIAFHLAAGVDFVIATDHDSSDGTTEILERYERDGVLHLIREESSEYRQAEWVTRMARLAATRFGADWVINSDADEFWWPRGGSLHEVLEAIPQRYGIARSFFRNFVPVGGDQGEFFERMIYRLSAKAPINDPTSPWRPQPKVVHRADDRVVVTTGSHAVRGTSLLPLRGWYPLEVLHFPMRSAAQVEKKGSVWKPAFDEIYLGAPGHTGAAYHALLFKAAREGESHAYYESFACDRSSLERGVQEGILQVDTRVRDALRTINAAQSATQPGVSRGSRQGTLVFPRASVVDEATFAVEAAVLGEADVIRLQRRVDRIELRLLALELRLPSRIYRKAARVAKRLLRRGQSLGHPAAEEAE